MHSINDQQRSKQIASTYGYGNAFEKSEKKPVDKNKKIGKTKSGKDVFSHMDPSEYEDFDMNDHRDAGDLHHEAASKGDGAFPGHHRAMRNKHTDEAIKGSKKAEKDKLKAQPGAGDIITTKDGIGGSVKHRDETHTYIEYDHEADGKKLKKISKIKNDDVDSKIAAGHYTHHKPTNVKKDDLKKGEESELEKAGEGSKGGKVIGHTKSGKPIYDNHKNSTAKKYTPEEHADAYEAHKKKMDEAKKEIDTLENDRNTDHWHKRYDDAENAYERHYQAYMNHNVFKPWKKSETNLNIIKSHQSEISKQIYDTFSKGGEGSKEGKVIGHTQSGKPIYSNAGPRHPLNINYTSNDHRDAVNAHMKRSGDFKNAKDAPSEEAKKHWSEMSDRHRKHAEDHFEVAGQIEEENVSK